MENNIKTFIDNRSLEMGLVHGRGDLRHLLDEYSAQHRRIIHLERLLATKVEQLQERVEERQNSLIPRMEKLNIELSSVSDKLNEWSARHSKYIGNTPIENLHSKVQAWYHNEYLPGSRHFQQKKENLEREIQSVSIEIESIPSRFAYDRQEIARLESQLEPLKATRIDAHRGILESLAYTSLCECINTANFQLGSANLSVPERPIIHRSYRQLPDDRYDHYDYYEDSHGSGYGRRHYKRTDNVLYHPYSRPSQPYSGRRDRGRGYDRYYRDGYDREDEYRRFEHREDKGSRYRSEGDRDRYSRKDTGRDRRDDHWDKNDRRFKKKR